MIGGGGAGVPLWRHEFKQSFLQYGLLTGKISYWESIGLARIGLGRPKVSLVQGTRSGWFGIQALWRYLCPRM